MKIPCYLLMFSLLTLTGCGRRKPANPPDAILSSFESRFGNSIGAEWELSADTAYIASFKESNHPSKAYFDMNGTWIKTETELLSSELPSIIVKTVLGSFKGSTISKSLLVNEGEKESIYRLSLKRRGNLTEVDLTAGGVILNPPQVR